MKVEELYTKCKKLVEENKGHYDVYMQDKSIGYFTELFFQEIIEESEQDLGTLVLVEDG